MRYHLHFLFRCVEAAVAVLLLFAFVQWFWFAFVDNGNLYYEDLCDELNAGTDPARILAIVQADQGIKTR